MSIDWHGVRTQTGEWKYPVPNATTGTWWVWDVDADEYVDSGAPARGPQGDPGKPGTQGDPGRDGRDGTGVYVTGIDQSSVDGGVNYINFSDGTTLEVRNGNTGAAGPAGKDGKDGLPGRDGDTGPQGIQGIPGIPGIGVTVADVTESDVDGGTNTVTFSDGTTLAVKNGNTGSQGPRGYQGQTGLPGKDGKDGKDGQSYEITDADYDEIAGRVDTMIAGERQAALDAIDDAKDDAVADVAAEGTTQTGLVEAKGEEVIGSIPEDYSELSADVSELKSDLTLTGNKKITEVYNPTIVPDKYVNKSGTVSSSSSYYYFEVDNLSEGDIVSAKSFYNNTTSIVLPYFRFVCAYDAQGSAVSASGAEQVYYQYTVPQGITKVAISIQSTYPLESVWILKSADVIDLTVNNKVESSVFSKFPQSTSGNLGNSETMSLAVASVKKNKDILFYGKITSFNQITIGNGTDSDINGACVIIDSTNLTYHYGTTGTATVAHGLTFADYISVTVSVQDNFLPTVTIMTNGGSYTYSGVSMWIGCQASVYATADATTALTDCTLTFVCRDLDYPIWVFGDSYVSPTLDRWVPYVINMGFKEFLLNGFSGETSFYGIRDLLNLLNYGTPKYIIWALGMNDADLTSGISPLWKNAVDEFVGLCNERYITPILCTIPNVPSRSHIYKNDYVINSGYHYIDFASAVGALDDFTWYSGMLSSDNVHPTAQGGMALAAELLKDFPYICIK